MPQDLVSHFITQFFTFKIISLDFFYSLSLETSFIAVDVKLNLFFPYEASHTLSYSWALASAKIMQKCCQIVSKNCITTGKELIKLDPTGRVRILHLKYQYFQNM